MAAATTPATCLSSASLFCKSRTRIIETPFIFVSSSICFCRRKFSCFLALSTGSKSNSKSESSFASSALPWSTPNRNNRLHAPPVFFALVQDEPLTASPTPPPPIPEEHHTSPSHDLSSLRPCQLYICNLPSSFGISEILHLFKTYGTVQSVEVLRNAETGISRGCGYVAMSSIQEAKAAISALDGSDVGGREMRVSFSVDVNTERNNLMALNTTPMKNFVFESHYKVYVGNLAWSVKPEDLRNLFSQFGTIVSARVLHDGKAGKNRVYGFLSFSSAAELEAAISLHGTDFCGRTLVVRDLLKKSEP